MTAYYFAIALAWTRTTVYVYFVADGDKIFGGKVSKVTLKVILKVIGNGVIR